VDLNNPYDVLNAYFPGEFTLRERLRPESGPPPSANFSLAEAAEYLGVSQRHLKDLCLDRRIVFSKPHYRAFSFRKKDLDAFLDLYRSYRP
jgi:excisionase family DNA binding protein